MMTGMTSVEFYSFKHGRHEICRFSGPNREAVLVMATAYQNLNRVRRLTSYPYDRGWHVEFIKIS